MQFAFVDSSSILYCIALLDKRVQYRAATHYRLRSMLSLARLEQTIGKPIKVRSKVAPRIAGAQSCNAPIVVSAGAE
jgi:hypothetical protein